MASTVEEAVRTLRNLLSDLNGCEDDDAVVTETLRQVETAVDTLTTANYRWSEPLKAETIRTSYLFVSECGDDHESKAVASSILR
jgi:hypothetical protein